MPAVSAPFLAAVAVLIAAGVAKAVRPDFTARALRDAGLPATRSIVRAGAGAEVAVGAAALAWPGWATGLLVSASYLAFAVFVATALRKGWALSSCGCFGRPDSRPNASHVVLDVAAAGVSIWWSAHAPVALGSGLSSQPWQGAPLVLAAAVVAFLAYLVWTNPLVEVRK